MYQHVYYVLCFCKIYKWVCNNAWFAFDLGFVKMMKMWIVVNAMAFFKVMIMERKCILYCFRFIRLTLGIGNLMSSHSLSAGHVPLGLGRDKVGIRALAQFMHFQLRYLFSLLLRWLGSIMSLISLRCVRIPRYR